MGKEHQSPKQVIQSYLEERAKRDQLFATSYAKPNKKIDECYDYIISQAKKRGGSVVCMSADEVFGLAVHYYDEDNIKVNKQSKSKVVVPKQPEKQKELTLTAEKSKLEQVAPNKRKGKKKEIPSGQFLLFEDL